MSPIPVLLAFLSYLSIPVLAQEVKGTGPLAAPRTPSVSNKIPPQQPQTPGLTPVPQPGSPNSKSEHQKGAKTGGTRIAGEAVHRGKPGQDVAFNFSNAKLFDIIQQVARLAGLNYTIDQSIKDGPVRLFMNGKLEQNSIEDVLALALKLNGVAVIRNGDFLEFVPATGSAAKAGTPLVYGTQVVEDVGNSFVITQIIPLQFLDAEGFASFAKDFLSHEGKATAHKGRNWVVVVDYLQNLRRVLNFVDVLDKQPFEQKRLALFRLRNAAPDRLLKELEPLLKAANVPVGTGALQILPITSLNGLLVISQTTEWIPDLKVWIERFDESPRTEEGELFVLALRHAKAESIYPLLTQVLRLQGGSSPSRAAPPLSSIAMTPGRAFGQSQFSSFSAPGLGSSSSPSNPIGSNSVPITPTPQPSIPSTNASPQSAGGPLSPSASISLDVDNNALLIFGTQRDYALIEGAVEKLDQLPRQVLIEATILDLNLTGEFEFGISGFLQEHFKPTEVNVNNVAGVNYSRDLRIDRPASDAAFTFTGVFTNRFGLLKAILSAKDSRTNANVISQPRVWALDNRPARLLVQDQIPIPVNTFIPGVGTGTGSSGYNVTNVQYLDTGLNLTVTPHINGSGVIRLEIQQEISSSTGVETLGSGASAVQAPRISRRTLSTELIAEDGATIVLGGLIRQNKSEVSVGLPVLNRIPLIRHLVSSRRTVNEKSELVILLTPKVVATPEDADRVTRELKARVTRAIGSSWLDKLIPATPSSPSLPGSGVPRPSSGD